MSKEPKTIQNIINCLALSGLTRKDATGEYVSYQTFDGREIAFAPYRIPEGATGNLVQFETLLSKGNCWILHENGDGSVYFTRRPHSNEQAEEIGGRGCTYDQAIDGSALTVSDEGCYLGDVAIDPDSPIAFYDGIIITKEGKIKKWHIGTLRSLACGVYPRANMHGVFGQMIDGKKVIKTGLIDVQNRDRLPDFPNNHLIVMKASTDGSELVTALFPLTEIRLIRVSNASKVRENTLYTFTVDADGVYTLTPDYPKQGEADRLLFVTGNDTFVLASTPRERSAIRGTIVVDVYGKLSFGHVKSGDQRKGTLVYGKQENDREFSFLYLHITDPDRIDNHPGYRPGRETLI